MEHEGEIEEMGQGEGGCRQDRNWGRMRTRNLCMIIKYIPTIEPNCLEKKHSTWNTEFLIFLIHTNLQHFKESAQFYQVPTFYCTLHQVQYIVLIQWISLLSSQNRFHTLWCLVPTSIFGKYKDSWIHKSKQLQAFSKIRQVMQLLCICFLNLDNKFNADNSKDTFCSKILFCMKYIIPLANVLISLWTNWNTQT